MINKKEEEKGNMRNSLWDIELPMEVREKGKRDRSGFVLGCFREEEGISIYLEGFFENAPSFTLFVNKLCRVIAHEIAHREILKELRSNRLVYPEIEDEEEIVSAFCGERQFYSMEERREEPEYFRIKTEREEKHQEMINKLGNVKNGL